MRRRSVVLPLLCALSCQPPRAAPIPPPAVDPPAAEPDASDARSTAPSPDLTALRGSAQALAAAVRLTPSPRAPGPPLGATVAGVKRIRSRWYPAPDVPPHKVPYLVDRIELLFSVAPWSTAEGRELVVRFQTRVPTAAAVLYAGVRLAADPLAPPRYRDYSVESRETPGVDHEVRISIDEVLDARKDVDGVLARGFGELSWQIEVPYPGSGSTVITDGRLAVRFAGDGLVPQPTVTLGPLVHQVGEDSAIISFETDVPTVGAVAVGSTVTALSGQTARRHEVRVEGLSANTEYPYRVVVSDGQETAAAPERRFTTADDGPLTVAILSDSRSGVGPGRRSYNGVNAAVLSALTVGATRNGAEAIFFPGDLIDGYVAHADDYDWQLRAWLQIVEGVHGEVPIYTGMGNHEALVDVWTDGVVLDKAGPQSAEARFAARMVNPGGAPAPERPGAPPYSESVYSVDIQGVHFVMLNTNYWYTRQPGHERHEGTGNREGNLMQGQLQWLAADLAAAADADYIVVMGHEPAFPVGGHTKDAMWWHGKIAEVNAMREAFWRLLAEHRVLAYVSGDEHNYSRALIGPETVKGAAGSVYSVISGGCGAPYYALDPPPEYADRVQAFSGEQHYTLWTFERGSRPRLRVYGLTGGLIEDVRLAPEPPPSLSSGTRAQP
ncbi:MAG: metallophosphoesterase family protein [Myxococcota bacterium]